MVWRSVAACAANRRPGTPRSSCWSAKSAEADIAAGLGVGANDYITKPFSISEVIERLHSLLQRVEADMPEIYDDGHLRIDFAEMRVFCNGGRVRLTIINRLETMFPFI